MAAQEMLPEAPITVIDSLSTAMGMYLMLDAAAQATADGATRQETAALLEDLKDRVSVSFVVDTLEYLAKGGRIGGATALLGSVLKIKPILSLRNGQVDQFEKERTQKRAFDRLAELVSLQASRNGDAFISVMHAAVPKLAVEFAARLCRDFGLSSCPILDVPPAIVTHGGPGILAAAFFTGE